MYTQASYSLTILLSLRKMLKNALIKLAAIQVMTYDYVHVHTFNLFSTKPVNWDGLLFISMSIVYHFKLNLMLYLTTFWTHIVLYDIINVNSFVLFGNCLISIIS